MLLKVKPLKLLAGKPIAILHEETARFLNLHVGKRIRIKGYGRKKEIVAPIDLTGGRTMLSKGEIALSQEIIKTLNLKSKAIIEISPALKPLSLSYIHKKLEGQSLTFTEIYSIISDIVRNELTEAEVAFFVSSVAMHGMSINETVAMTKAMVRTGHKIKFDEPIIIDKHSIGGVEGNRTTPIVVSIIAAAIDHLKLKAVMPKTSSRAITSAAGTADVIETLARVEFSIPEIKKIINKTKACLVWGGSLGLAPADDKIIQVERILSLDPEAQLIASILSKKLSVNATHVLIDVSYGNGAKMRNKLEALRLKSKFEKIASMMNLNIKVVLTDGSQPIGNGIGTALEMRDVIAVLRQDKQMPLDLEQRSIFLASELLSFVKKIPIKEAETIVKGLIISGKAFEKFREILKAQGGNLSDIEEKLKLAKLKEDIRSAKAGIVIEISNKKMARIGRILGAPADHGAGIFLHKHLNDKVKKNEKIFTIYAGTKAELEYAKNLVKRTKPMIIK